ncbi:MAG: alkaline phosphatase, partial [Actinomycetota bacterium]|nr:alkaline phosphatase [Actinomycetota bacterium]
MPGDNEYDTRGAAGYFSYFGRVAKPKGRSYYSFDLDSWHLIALDSNIRRGLGSAQERWLKADLARTSKRCILAYWHLPLSASHQGKTINTSVGAFWT